MSFLYLLFLRIFFFFFFNDTATTEIYTLSLHDALPISVANSIAENLEHHGLRCWLAPRDVKPGDRKSTRLNSSHGYISYAVFCLKKKKKKKWMISCRKVMSSKLWYTSISLSSNVIVQ